MSYTLRFSITSLEDIERHKKSGDRATMNKIELLLNELKEHPTTGTGQPEKLKHDLVEMYSRWIYKKHRLVYTISEQVLTVHVLSAWAHYGDK